MTAAQSAWRVLLGVDGSAGSEDAISFLAALPHRARDEVLVASRPAYVLAARPDGGDPASRVGGAAAERAAAVVDLAVAHLAGAGVRARGVACDGASAVDGLLRAADREHASLIVVGSRGRGAWATVLLGSTARSLAMLSPLPVLVVRTPRPPLRVLAATDGSPAARAALAAFAQLPRSEGESVELLHVLPEHELDPSGATWSTIGARTEVERREADAAVTMCASQRRLLPAGTHVEVRIERGHAGETIQRRAEDGGADLIVLGTRGLAGPRALLFGSTAERVLTHTRANVLVAPPQET